MSKAAIDKLLDDVLEHIKSNKNYREESDRKEHHYSVSSSTIAGEIESQLNPLIKDRKDLSTIKGTIKTLADNYASSLFDSFNKDTKGRQVTYSFKAGSTKTDFTVIVSPKSSKSNAIIFKAINNERTAGGDAAPLHKLRNDIIELIFNNAPSRKALDLIKGGVQKDKKTGEVLTYPDGREIRTGGLLQLGHISGSSIAEKRTVMTLDHIESLIPNIPNLRGNTGGGTSRKGSKITLRSAVKSFISAHQLKEISVSLEYTGVRDESATANSRKGASEEKALIKDIEKELKSVLAGVDWVNQKGSMSPKDMAFALLTDAALSAGANPKKSTKRQKIPKDRYTTKPKVLQNTVKISASKDTLGGKKASRAKEESSTPTGTRSWASLITIINAKLPETVANNMGAPGLVYRTGRFANSTKVVNVETTRDGYPSVVFDYERDPYDVFDRIKGASPWNTPARDPRALVDRSVREIVQEMAIGRFYTRRA